MNLFEKKYFLPGPTVFHTQADRPGWFRIGCIVLDIPPQSIVTTRVTNKDEVQVLRADLPMQIPSNQSRWDVTIRWSAIALPNEDGTWNYAQWEDLRYILAMFKAAPFVEVENQHLRQIFAGIDPTLQAERMAFGMRQLKIDTDPNIIHGLSCSLTMTYFNYHPYTHDFGYQGSGNQPTDAYQCDLFRQYLENWMQTNLVARDSTTSHDEGGFDPAQDWKSQTPGTLILKWRRYIGISLDEQNNGGIVFERAKLSTLSPTSSIPISMPRAGTAGRMPKLSDDTAVLVYRYADKFGVDRNIAYAQIAAESSGNSQAVSKKGAQGMGQLMPATARQLGVTNPFDPEQNIRGSMRYMGDLLHQFHGNYAAALAGYNYGPPRVQSYLTGTPVHMATGDVFNKEGKQTTNGIPPVPETVDYVNKILTWAGQSSPAPIVMPSTPSPTPVEGSTPVALSQEQEANLSEDLRRKVLQYKDKLAQGGWELDHYTERECFFYQEYDVKLTDTNHGDENNIFSLFPEQISLVFVNNLAQIPLAGRQFPTYQHIGAPGTMIAVGLSSVGLTDDTHTEPVHPGVQALSYMSHQLAEQFQRMKCSWRRIDSVYRMQATRVYNQVLNMLGIFGLMVSDVHTTTLEDSCNVLQVNLSASQYENVFEALDGYLVNGSSDAYQSVLLGLLRSPDLTKGLSQKELDGINHVVEIQKQMNDRSMYSVAEMALKLEEGDDTLARAPSATTMHLTNEERDFLFLRFETHKEGEDISTESNTGVSSSGPSTRGYRVGGPDGIAMSEDKSNEDMGRLFASAGWPGLYHRGQQLKSTSEVGWFDVYCFAWARIQTYTDKERKLVLSLRQKAQAVGADHPDEIDKLYDYYFLQTAARDTQLGLQVAQIVNSPSFGQRIKNLPEQPGQNRENHGAYRDMGLRNRFSSQDLNPGMYFIDYSRKFGSDMRKGIEATVATTISTETQKNASVRPAGGFSSDSFSSQDLPVLLRQIQTPEYKMAAAFPTFKLFFLEENSNGPFYAFDNFYSWASVSDIEIIRYRDQPDQAIVQITNLAHLLNQRLFDDTVMGKHEREHYYQDLVNTPQSGDGTRPVSGPSGGAYFAVKDALGVVHQLALADRQEGYGHTYKEIPLQYFPLRAGTKIEIRMGSSNDPDNLVRVFAGTVAEIEGQDMLTIHASGFMAELMDAPSDKLHKGGRLGLAHLLGGGPDFGGMGIAYDSGDVGSLLKRFLEASNARHFGHWQMMKRVSNRMMQGFKWERTAGDILTMMGSSHIGPALSNSYDRSGENILINHVINTAGQAEKTKESGKNLYTAPSRTYFDQVPRWTAWSPYYYIPEDAKTLWDLIHDCSRRYPEYNLLVKPYGFPYGADATLVFAHPRDSYYHRPYSYDETRRESAKDRTAEETGLFAKWWTEVGEQTFRTTVERSNQVSPSLLRVARNVFNIIYTVGSNLGMPGAFPLGAVADEEIAIDRINSGGVNAFNDILETQVNRWINRVAEFFTTGYTNIIVEQGRLDQMRLEWSRLRAAWQAYRDLQQHPNDPLLQPVRKFHYVDDWSIVANNITVNDQIYNTVQVNKGRFPANPNIPDVYQRVLICDPMIVLPKDNAKASMLPTLYAQSFLREEVGKMYRGELVLRGRPAIEPGDVIFLADTTTGMTGPVEVDKVIHSFNLETGYTTIVTPRLFVSINETSGKDWISRVAIGMSNFWSTLVTSPWAEFKSRNTSTQALMAAGAATKVGMSATAVVGVMKGAGAVKAALLATGKLSSSIAGEMAASSLPAQMSLPFDAATALEISSAPVQLELFPGLAAAAAEGVAAEGTATSAAAMIPAFALNPPALVAAAVVAAIAVGGACYVIAKNESLNPILISPLLRWGKPWTGGLQGYEISDYWRFVGNGWRNFWVDEVEPTLLSYKVVKGYWDNDARAGIPEH